MASNMHIAKYQGKTNGSELVSTPRAATKPFWRLGAIVYILAVACACSRNESTGRSIERVPEMQGVAASRDAQDSSAIAADKPPTLDEIMAYLRFDADQQRQLLAGQIITGSIDTGRWVAMRMVPPAAAEAGGAEAPVEAPADGAPPDAAGVEHAAMSMLIVGIDMPRIAPRFMNVRRLILPAARDSTRSSSWADAVRRNGSNRE